MTSALDSSRISTGRPTTLREVAAIFWRHPSPWALGVLAVSSTLLRFGLGPATGTDLLVAAGILALWPLLEWFLHVVVLHFKPIGIGSRTFDPLVPRKHREHHRDPDCIDLVFIPMPTFLTAPFLVGTLAWAILPTLPLAATAMATFWWLSFHYEWTHFLIHTRYLPRSRLYRRLRTHHRLHHFKNEHYWFGVSMTSGDRVLGTWPDPSEVATCRSVGEGREVRISRATRRRRSPG